jgi:hypothetical protein
VTNNQWKDRLSQANSGSRATNGSGVSAPFWDRRPLWILAGVFGVLVAMNMWGRVKPEEHGMVPQQVLGTWTTTDSDYADRAFEIRKNSVVFHTGGSDYTVHLIENVEVEDLDGPILVTIYYSQDLGTNIFSFYYDPIDGGVITFRNQRDMEWRRDS